MYSLACLKALLLLSLLTVSQCKSISKRYYDHSSSPTSFQQQRRSNPRHLSYGRSDGLKDIISPKIVIITMFDPEANVWYDNYKDNLYAINVTIPGLSPLFPAVHCTSSTDVCLITTSEGEINAASSTTAFALSPHFNLSKSYFLIAGIAGANPNRASIGSLAFARYSIQVGLEFEFDARELPSNSTTGYIPLGATSPTQYPTYIYGSEVFELNTNLRHRAVALSRRARLNDTTAAQAYRNTYTQHAARRPSQILECDITCSDVYFSGKLLSDSFNNYTTLMTNGTGQYCMTAQEDNATLAALLRASLSKLVDFSRILVMRSGTDYDQRPSSRSNIGVEQHLFEPNNSGFHPGVLNLYLAGVEVVNDVIDSWKQVYEKGIPAHNYIGDIFNSLGSNKKPDFGVPSVLLH